MACPAVDPRVLRDIVAELGQACADELAARYLEALPGRAARLRVALEAHDADDAYAAALSLRSTSAMVGAHAVAGAADALASAARSGLTASTAELLRALDLALPAVRAALVGLRARPGGSDVPA